MKPELKIGIVITLSIVVLIWGISYLKGNNLFSSDNYFYAEYNDIQGMTISTPVMLNGFKIGYVRKINFSEKNNSTLLVEISILEKYTLTKGSKAIIYSADIMGTKAVKIVLGKSSESLQDGDSIASGVEGDMLDEFLPLKDQLSSLLLSVDTVLSDVHVLLDTSSKKNIKGMLSNLNATTSTLNTFMSTETTRLKAIFINVDSITSMLSANSTNLNNAISNFSNISDSLAKSKLKETIENANKTLAKTALIMEKINSGEGTLGALVKNDTLYYNLENSTKSLNKLLIDLKENPNRYVNFSLFGGKKVKD